MASTNGWYRLTFNSSSRGLKSERVSIIQLQPKIRNANLQKTTTPLIHEVERLTKRLFLFKTNIFLHFQKENCFSFLLMYHMIGITQFMHWNEYIFDDMFVNVSVIFSTDQ